VNERTGTSTVLQVVAAITAAVRAGHLVPGQRLTESQFTQRLGVSRSSVREAFQRLTADGLLAFEPNRGVTVRQLSRRGVDNLFHVRGALESLAVRLALPVLAARPERLIAVGNDLDAAVEKGETNRFSDLNRTFHALFVEAADNPLLADMLQRLGNSLYWLQFRVLIDSRAVFETNVQHRQIVQAVLAKDARAAEAAMLDHVERSRQLVQSLSDEHFTACEDSHGDT
jgi:DNA-binding GntR family transcriptional regulator